MRDLGHPVCFLVSLCGAFAQSQNEGVMLERLALNGLRVRVRIHTHQLTTVTAKGSSFILSPAGLILRAGPCSVARSTVSAVAVAASASGISMVVFLLLTRRSLRPAGVMNACAARSAEWSPLSSVSTSLSPG